MKLDLIAHRYVRLDVSGLTLRCYDINGNFTCHSLDGVTKLYCSHNQLQSLPVLPNGLEELFCSNNQLESLPTLPETLKVLNCEINKLKSLPVLPNSLEELYCSSNQLESLPALPNGLRELYCPHNQLLALSEHPALPNGLRELYCRNNHLQSLPILPESLEGLICEKNPLVFILPLAKRPKCYRVPKRFELLHSPENYPNFYNKYQTYVYLITYLVLDCQVLPTILTSDLLHFWK